MTRWYMQTTTHLSKDGEYYIVPVVYERMIYNEALKPFFNSESGTLNIDALRANKVFTDSAKLWALEKLAADLAKAIGPQNRAESPIQGILPGDSSATIEEGKIPGKELRAESWHIDPRPPEYQNLFLKIMFSKSWVDALPPKVNPDIAATMTGKRRNVLLEIKTLKKDLSNLQLILRHFDYQILQSRTQPAFDASCSADKISKIPELLNRLLQENDKPLLGTNSPAAIQLGFTEGLELQYVAYADLPDCLCDEENINAYILKKGVDKLKKTPPFDSITNNGLLYYLPEIKRKYSPYLQGAKKQHLFSSQESWVKFVKSYVVPQPEILFDNEKTTEQWLASTLMRAGQLGKDVNSLLKKSLYPGLDPTAVLPPESRKQLLGMANAQVNFGGDDVMLKALTSEIYSTTTLFDNLLNKVPVYELIKIAIVAIVKCSGDTDFKKKLCEMVINMMTYDEIRTDLYPCLQESGAAGEQAIRLLEVKLTGKLTDVYDKMEKRYPDKFKGKFDPETGQLGEGMGSVWEEEAKIAAMNELYCGDTYLQKLLGRAPDDFSEEMLEWLEEAAGDAVCDCILSFYGPAQQMLGFVESTKEGVQEIADTFDMNNARAIEQQSTVALDRILQPFYTLTEDGLSGFGAAILRGLQDMLFTIIFAAVLVVLQHVKNQIVGGLMKDICGSKLSNPFSRTSITNMIMNSTLYEDHTYAQLKKNIKKIGKLSGYAAEFQQIIKAFQEIETSFTPSEIKRLLTTPCDDNSADDLYAQAQLAFVAPTSISMMNGTPTMAALAAMGLNPLPAEQEEVPSLDVIHSFLAGVGNEIDPILLEENIENWENVKAGVLNLCDPEGFNVFEATLDPENIKKQALRNQDDLLDDISEMMPLLDPNQIANMMPPLFCGPCKPSQVGTKPLMPSQTHPSQLFLVDRLNSSIYKSIDRVFNNNISVYKPLLSGTRDSQKQLTNVFSQLLPEGESTDLDDEAMSALKNKLFKGLINHGKDAVPEDESKDVLVAQRLLASLEETLSVNHMVYEDIPKFSIFKYEIKGVVDSDGTVVEMPYDIFLIFNFSQGTVIKQGITTHQNQIKIVVKNEAGGPALYEWPGAEEIDHQVADFDITDWSGALQDYFFSVPSGETYKIISQMHPANLQNQVPIIMNLILETILAQGTSKDMFKSKVFNKIPLTNQEAQKKCKDGIGATPLLNIEQLKEDVSKTQQSLECVVSMFATPDAVQIANIYGLYKLLIKICIVEEYLKNIFMFGFVKVSDVIRTDAYMRFVLDNLIGVVGSTLGQNGYANLLTYSEKIINGREQLKEVASTATPLGDIKPAKTKEECLKILILEAAQEIEAILNSRVQNIVDPGWIGKFQAFDGLDENQIYGRMLSYAILATPEHWSPNLYPGPSKSEGSDFIASAMTQLPSLDDAPNLWPMYTNMKHKMPWNGGLFFQPVMKFVSKISSKEKFWLKFDEVAYKHKLQSTDFNDSYDKEITEAVNLMINKVNEETLDGPTFTKFWKLFFEPEKSMDFVEGYSKAPFMRLVSSFNHKSQDSLINEPDKHYYYWDNEWEGTTKDFPWHWAWRGAMSTDSSNLIGTKGTFGTEYHFQLAKSFTDTAIGDHSGIPLFAPVFGYSKNVPFFTKGASDTDGFLEALGMAKELFPNVYEFHPDQDDLWFYNAVVSPWMAYDDNKLLGLPKRTASFLKELGIEMGTTKLDGGWGSADDYRKGALFWRRIRDIIFDSDYSHWFDIKMGMRLNALFPMTKENKNSLEKLNFNSDSTAYKVLNAHNEDKLIWWEGPIGPYLCVPLDYVEHTYKPGEETTFAGFIDIELQNIKNKSALKSDNYSFKSSSTPLWAVTKSLGTVLAQEKNDLLRTFQSEVSNKVLSPTGGENNKVLNELLPIKDILMVGALMYRYHIVGAYPFLNDFFGPTKDTLNRCIAQMLASQEGNYDYMDSFAAQLDPTGPDPTASPDAWEIAEKFMLLVVQMGANIADPTWKTPWFMPGPLTPVGILAKILASKDEDTPDKEGPLTEPQPPCPEENALIPDASAMLEMVKTEQQESYMSAVANSPTPSLACAGKDALYWIVKFPRDTTEDLYRMTEDQLNGALGSIKGPSWKTFVLEGNTGNPSNIFNGTTSNLFYPPWSEKPGGSLFPNSWEAHCADHAGNVGSVIPLANGLNKLVGYPEGDLYPYDVNRWLNMDTIPGGDPYNWSMTYGDIQIPYSFVLRDRIFFSLINCSTLGWRPWLEKTGAQTTPKSTFRRVYIGDSFESATAAIAIPVKSSSPHQPAWLTHQEILKPHGSLIDYLQENSGMEIVSWFETTPSGLHYNPYPDWGSKLASE